MTTSLLSVRVSPEERVILVAASEQAHTSPSDLVRRKAVGAAESDMLERRIVTIPAKDWDAFETWAREPAVTQRRSRNWLPKHRRGSGNATDRHHQRCMLDGAPSRRR